MKKASEYKTNRGNDGTKVHWNFVVFINPSANLILQRRKYQNAFAANENLTFSNMNALMREILWKSKRIFIFVSAAAFVVVFLCFSTHSANNFLQIFFFKFW